MTEFQDESRHEEEQLVGRKKSAIVEAQVVISSSVTEPAAVENERQEDGNQVDADDKSAPVHAIQRPTTLDIDCSQTRIDPPPKPGNRDDNLSSGSLNGTSCIIPSQSP